MAKVDPRVDAYIKKSAEFAQPILVKIRSAFHKADADIEETIKWGIPYFQKNGLVGGMAAFKKHVDVGFWKAKQLSDPKGLFGKGSSMAGLKAASPKDLPAQGVLVAYIREAIALNEKPAQAPKRKPVKVPMLPDDFRAAMRGSRKAKLTFENFAPSHQRDYIEWILEAKQAATRERRINQAVEWLAEGKPRHWKYMKR